MVAKGPIVDEPRPEFNIFALVYTVRCFWFWKCLQPKMRLRFRDSTCVQFLHGASVYDGGIRGILLASL